MKLDLSILKPGNMVKLKDGGIVEIESIEHDKSDNTYLISFSDHVCTDVCEDDDVKELLSEYKIWFRQDGKLVDMYNAFIEPNDIVEFM